VFDDTKHDLHLNRALGRFEQGNDFLLLHAAADMVERLSAVNLEFETAVTLFCRTPGVVDLFQSSNQIKQLMRVEERRHLGVADKIATPDHLRLEEQSVDLVLAPLTLHWSNDLPGSLIQILRSLRPNGLMLATLPGPDTLIELRQSLLQAEAEITGGAANRIDPFTDIRDAGGLLQRAGFSLPVVDQELLTVRYDTALDLIRDLRRFGATSHLAKQPTDATIPALNRAIIARMVEIYADRFSDADGRIRASFSLISLSGWSPHESQQKPLRPGSAKSRLADALNVEEVKLKR